MQKGQFFLLEAGVPHTYAASRTNPWSIYWIHFTGQQSHVFRSMFNHVFEITETAEARLQERLALFEEIFLNLETGYSPDNLSYASSCLWHLLASYRYIVQFRTIKRIRHTDFAQTAIATCAVIWAKGSPSTTLPAAPTIPPPISGNSSCATRVVPRCTISTS